MCKIERQAYVAKYSTNSQISLTIRVIHQKLSKIRSKEVLVIFYIHFRCY